MSLGDADDFANHIRLVDAFWFSVAFCQQLSDINAICISDDVCDPDVNCFSYRFSVFFGQLLSVVEHDGLWDRDSVSLGHADYVSVYICVGISIEHAFAFFE